MSQRAAVRGKEGQMRIQFMPKWSA